MTTPIIAALAAAIEDRRLDAQRAAEEIGDPTVTAAIGLILRAPGMEQANREAHRGIARQKAANERLRAEVAKLRDVIVRANDLLFDAEDLDPEHTIECHADTLPDEYRQLSQGVSEALALLSAEACEMVEPEAK